MSPPTNPTPSGGDQRPRDPKATRTWRIAAVGAGIGVLLAATSGLLGADGRVGMVVLLLVTALGCGVAALYGGLTAVIDDLKGRPVQRRRPIAAGALFLVAAMLMAMVAGAGG